MFCICVGRLWEFMANNLGNPRLKKDVVVVWVFKAVSALKEVFSFLIFTYVLSVNHISWDKVANAVIWFITPCSFLQPASFIFIYTSCLFICSAFPDEGEIHKYFFRFLGKEYFTGNGTIYRLNTSQSYYQCPSF